MRLAPTIERCVFLCLTACAAAQPDYPLDREPPSRHAARADITVPRGEPPQNRCGPLPLEPFSAIPFPQHSQFGQVIDLSDGRLIVGDPLHDEPLGQDDIGAAYFFEKLGDEWLPRGRVVLPQVGIDSNFGRAVAIDGDYALASTPYFRAYRGEAFVFQRHAGPDGVEWRQSANIKPNPAETPLFYFGYDVDLSGNIAAVSGLYSASEPNGWVELHALIDGSWRPLARVRPPDGTIFDDFGRSISLSGSRLLVGAPFHPDPTYQGAAYLFHKIESGWVFEANLTPPNLEPSGLVGWQVALDQDTAVVASPYTSSQSPKIWIYHLADDQWTLEATLFAPLDNSYDDSDFARSIDLKGDTLIVGAPYAEIWGAAYIYRRINGLWAFTGRVRFDDVSTTNRFIGDLGRSVAVEGTTAVASAPYSTVSESNPIVTGFLQPIDLSGEPFAITRHPDYLRAEVGDSAVFNAAAVGPGELHYQWIKGVAPVVDDGRITGAQSPTLSINPLVIEDSAFYFVRVTSDVCGTIESRGALLDLGNCIEVTTTPLPQMLIAGAPLIMQSGANGVLPLTFQWTRSGQDLIDDGRITGSNTTTLSINPTLPEDQAVYRMRITSQCGETQTNEATVSFLPCSEITSQPEDIYTFVGATLRLEVAATSHLPLTYQWWRNGSLLGDGGRFSGTTTPTLVITDSISLDAAKYKCFVSCVYNERTSREATVTLNPAGCLGDANNDHRVNMVDLSAVLEAWGANYRPVTGPGDTDRDGLVGFSDLTMVLGRYGSVCP